MGEVEVVAEEVDALADRLECGGDVVEVKVDKVVEGLLGAGVEGRIFVGARGEAAEEGVEMRKRGRRVEVGDGRVAFELRIAQSEEAEGGDAEGWHVMGLGR